MGWLKQLRLLVGRRNLVEGPKYSPPANLMPFCHKSRHILLKPTYCIFVECSRKWTSRPFRPRTSWPALSASQVPGDIPSGPIKSNRVSEVCRMQRHVSYCRRSSRPVGGPYDRPTGTSLRQMTALNALTGLNCSVTGAYMFITVISQHVLYYHTS